MQKVRQYASLGCAVAGIQFNTHGCRANSRATAGSSAAANTAGSTRDRCQSIQLH